MTHLKRLLLRSCNNAVCLLGFVIFARVAGAQAPPPVSENVSDVPKRISYVNGQLKIDATDVSLSDILTQVAALTGVKIDIPSGANGQMMPVVKLGPGPAREVLASLLSGAHFDYLIQASDTDPDKIQSVLVMVADKKGSKPPDIEMAGSSSRSARARIIEQEEKSEEAVTVSPIPATAETPAEPSAPNSQLAPVQPDQFGGMPSVQAEQSTSPRPGALSPPPVMSPENINQQLQQMYQQRMQMIQQSRQGASPTPSAGPGGN